MRRLWLIPFLLCPASAADASLRASLLKVAQAQPNLAQRPYCQLVGFTKDPATLSSTAMQSTEMQLAVKQGYFTATPKGDQVVLKPTAKYLALLKHAEKSTSGFPKYCFGTAKLTSLANLQQASPDKYLAQGVFTPVFESWATPDVVKIFGPGRNAPQNVPINLVFYGNGSTWDVEKR